MAYSAEDKSFAGKCLTVPVANLAINTLNARYLLPELAQGLDVEAFPREEFGQSAIVSALLGILAAAGQLEIKDARYQISPSMTDQNVREAEWVESVYYDLVENPQTAWNHINIQGQYLTPENKQALALPTLFALEREGWDNEEGWEALYWVGAAHEPGTLSPVGDILYSHPVVSGFARLSNSYRTLLANLDHAIDYPVSREFGQLYSRDPVENALASNTLIRNVTPKHRDIFRRHGVQSHLDMGSGGGAYAEELGAPSVVLLDISSSAQEEAKRLFSEKGQMHRLVGQITGDLTRSDDLSYAAEFLPDMVTINYIFHDLLGQAPTYQEGIEVIRKFFANYEHFFGSTPLMISESWFVDWKDLAQVNGKDYVPLFQFLHGISPQYLMDHDQFLTLLDQEGYQVVEASSNGSLPISGQQRTINETLIVQAR